MTHTLHLHQKLSLHSPRSLVLAIRSISTHRVYLIDKNDGGLFLSGHVEERFDQFLTFSHVLAHQIRRGNREECTVGLSCAGLCEEGLSSSRRTVQKDSLPGFTIASENLFEPNGQNDSFLQSVLGVFESRNILPLDIWFFSDDGIVDLALEVVVFLVALAAAIISTTSSSNCGRGYIIKELLTSFPSSLFLSLPLSSFSLFSYSDLTF
jgi:hypothetical protein